jgi:hypothetical protein
MVSRQGTGARGTRAGHRIGAEAWASARLTYLDNLKVALIALIIALHAVLGYAGIVEVWTYSGVREVTLTPVVEIVLVVLASPLGFVLITLLFLVAGLLTPRSYDRKGPKRFVVDRLLRLGVPFVVYVLLVQPVLVYAVAHPLGEAPGSFWEEYLGDEGQIDTGPLWFVGVLLVFSLGYAAWRGWGGRARGTVAGTRSITMSELAWVAAAVAPASFAVRLAYDYGSESGFSDLNLWEWPACIAAFGLGVAGARQGWLDSIPLRLAHDCRNLTVAAAVTMSALLVTAGAADAVESVLGGWHWMAMVFAVIESMLTVFGSVWLLSVAQRRLGTRCRWGAAMSRGAYAAFMIQTVVLLALAMALRPLDVPAEVKAPLVALGSVVGSFAAAWVLVCKVPGLSRIL